MVLQNNLPLNSLKASRTKKTKPVESFHVKEEHYEKYEKNSVKCL